MRVDQVMLLYIVFEAVEISGDVACWLRLRLPCSLISETVSYANHNFAFYLKTWLSNWNFPVLIMITLLDIKL